MVEVLNKKHYNALYAQNTGEAKNGADMIEEGAPLQLEAPLI